MHKLALSLPFVGLLLPACQSAAGTITDSWPSAHAGSSDTLTPLFAPRWQATAGYRLLGWEYEDSGIEVDLRLDGVLLGLAVQF